MTDNYRGITIDERTLMISEKRGAAEVGEWTRFWENVKGATVLIEIPANGTPAYGPERAGKNISQLNLLYWWVAKQLVDPG